MNNEEEILEKFLEYANCKECEENKCCPDCFIDKQEVQAIQGLLDLYEKEKEKNKSLLQCLKDSQERCENEHLFLGNPDM